ncbi:hypothetical protein GOODEAATRI_032855, partial [Goodea atripinnis]
AYILLFRRFAQLLNAACTPLSACPERLRWNRGASAINISRIPPRDDYDRPRRFYASGRSFADAFRLFSFSQ